MAENGDLRDKVHSVKVRLGRQPMDYKTFNDTLGLLEQLTTTQQKLDTAAEALEWLTKDHNVKIQTYGQAAYWANQFKIAQDKAKAALTSIKE